MWDWDMAVVVGKATRSLNSLSCSYHHPGPSVVRTTRRRYAEKSSKVLFISVWGEYSRKPVNEASKQLVLAWVWERGTYNDTWRGRKHTNNKHFILIRELRSKVQQQDPIQYSNFHTYIPNYFSWNFAYIWKLLHWFWLDSMLNYYFIFIIIAKMMIK